MILSHNSRAGRLLKVSPSKVRSQFSSALTAAMNGSVISTDKLNMRRRPASCLDSIKASISGWSQRITPIIAPRRDPALMMVRHMESHTSIKLNGPDASAPIFFTSAPLGRKVEKS